MARSPSDLFDYDDIYACCLVIGWSNWNMNGKRIGGRCQNLLIRQIKAVSEAKVYRLQLQSQCRSNRPTWVERRSISGRSGFSSDFLSTPINWRNSMKIPFVISEIFAWLCWLGWRLETLSAKSRSVTFSDVYAYRTRNGSERKSNYYYTGWLAGGMMFTEVENSSAVSYPIINSLKPHSRTHTHTKSLEAFKPTVYK